MARHSLKLAREVRLVVIVIVELRLQEIERYARSPFAVEALEPEDLGKNLRRQADVLVEESIQISPRVAGLPLQISDRHPAIDGSKPSDAVIDNPRLAAGLPREERELPLDVRDLPVHTVQVVDRLLYVAAPPSEHIVGFPESVGCFRHRHAEDWKRPVGPELDGDEAGLERARANECRRVADADEV